MAGARRHAIKNGIEGSWGEIREASNFWGQYLQLGHYERGPMDGD